MIDQALIFLKNHLNASLKAASSESTEELVVFGPTEKIDPINFELNKISLLLVRVEEEKVMRPPDLYSRPVPGVGRLPVQPDIRLILYVLCVARFSRYEDGLKYLSMAIRTFQAFRVIDHQHAPDLDDAIEKLILELVSLSPSDQNALWGALRTTYLPSLLYRVKMLTYQDDGGMPAPAVQEVIPRITS